jgi:hypothetical protein
MDVVKSIDNVAANYVHFPPPPIKVVTIVNNTIEIVEN